MRGMCIALAAAWVGSAAAQAPKPGVAARVEPQAAQRLAIDTARRAALDLGCPEPQLRAIGHSDVPPATRDAGVNLVSGASILHFSASGCSQQNVMVLMQPGQPVRGMALLPGSTMADAVLQRDALRPALTLAAGRLNGCQAVRIVDTRVVQPGQTANGRLVSAWAEEWVAAGCGGNMRIIVTLTPSAQEGTGYSLRRAD